MEEDTVSNADRRRFAEEARDGDGEVSNIDAAENDADERSNKVGDERANYFTKSTTDNDTNGKIDNVATVDELFEFAKEGKFFRGLFHKIDYSTG